MKNEKEIHGGGLWDVGDTFYFFVTGFGGARHVVMQGTIIKKDGEFFKVISEDYNKVFGDREFRLRPNELYTEDEAIATRLQV